MDPIPNFTPAKTPYSAKPNSHNVIVKQGNKILNPVTTQQFNVEDGVREYFLEIWQRSIGSFDNLRRVGIVKWY